MPLRRQHRAGQPGLAGKSKCVVPSAGKSDRAAREDVMLAQAEDEEQAVAAVWCGVVWCWICWLSRLEHMVRTTQGALHQLMIYGYTMAKCTPNRSHSQGVASWRAGCPGS